MPHSRWKCVCCFEEMGWRTRRKELWDLQIPIFRFEIEKPSQRMLQDPSGADGSQTGSVGGFSSQFEVGRKKHPGRESSAARIVPLDVRSALFSRSAHYPCSVSPGSWNTAPGWGWSWRRLCHGAVPCLFPPRGTSQQSQQWCWCLPLAPVPGVVGSSFPHSVPLLSLCILGHHLADVGLPFACPEGAPSSDVPKGSTARELLSPDVSRQSLCLHCIFTACLGSQLCQTPPVLFVHLALPYPS